jgi:hypothetical protein
MNKKDGYGLKRVTQGDERRMLTTHKDYITKQGSLCNHE